jgi:hypothetical protein
MVGNAFFCGRLFVLVGGTAATYDQQSASFSFLHDAINCCSQIEYLVCRPSTQKYFGCTYNWMTYLLISPCFFPYFAYFPYFKSRSEYYSPSRLQFPFNRWANAGRDAREFYWYLPLGKMTIFMRNSGQRGKVFNGRLVNGGNAQTCQVLADSFPFWMFWKFTRL